MLDTARLNEVNIIYHKILREMNCYSFIFGKNTSFFTGQSQSQQTFASELSLEAEAEESCWGAEAAGAFDGQGGRSSG